MRRNILEISEILDEQIKKAFNNKNLKKSVAGYEYEIKKGLSFDITNIQRMGNDEESGYYNPYQTSIDGGFFPYDVSYWSDRGKNPADYGDVAKYYENAGAYQDVPESIQNMNNAGHKFSFIKNSMYYSDSKDIMGNIDGELVLKSMEDEAFYLNCIDAGMVDREIKKQFFVR